MKSTIQRLLVSTAIALVPLASIGGQAMAANPHQQTHASAPYGYQAPLDVAAIPPYPVSSSGAVAPLRATADYDGAARPAYPQSGNGYPVTQWSSGYPVAGPGVDVGGLIAALVGGAVPLHYGGKATVSDSGSDFVDFSPPPDTSVSDAAGWAAEQSANDAAAAAIQQTDADLQALDASIAASEAQNDAANAAVQQDMTNLVNSQ